MKISARSVLMAGVATLTITATAAAPSVQPLPPPRPAIQLAAVAVQVLSHQLVDLLSRSSMPDGRIRCRRALASRFPIPARAVVRVPHRVHRQRHPDVYNAVEFWVDYGFEVGRLRGRAGSPASAGSRRQIMHLLQLRRQHRPSIVYNIADWLDGDISFCEGLINVGVDSDPALSTSASPSGASGCRPSPISAAAADSLLPQRRWRLTAQDGRRPRSASKTSPVISSTPSTPRCANTITTALPYSRMSSPRSRSCASWAIRQSCCGTTSSLPIADSVVSGRDRSRSSMRR